MKHTTQSSNTTKTTSLVSRITVGLIGISLLAVGILTVSNLFTKTTKSLAATPCPVVSGNYVSSSVSVPATSTYNVWSRIQAPDSGHTNYYLEIDGDCLGSIGASATTLAPNQWIWVNYKDNTTASKLSRQLSAGAHNVRMIGKDEGVKLDRLLLTADNCTPSVMGDNCMITSSPTPTVTITSTPTIKPSNTPTPTPTIKPSNTPTPTPTPTPTSTPTPKPSNTPTPTPTPNPTTTPRPTTSVEISNLQRWIGYDWTKGRYYIQLNWKNNGGPASNYLVFARNNKSNPLNSFAGSTRGDTDFRYFGPRSTGLQNNTTYHFSIIGIGQNGNASSPAITSATIQCYWWFCSVR